MGGRAARKPRAFHAQCRAAYQSLKLFEFVVDGFPLFGTPPWGCPPSAATFARPTRSTATRLGSRRACKRRRAGSRRRRRSDNMTIAPPLLPGYSGPGRKQLLRRPGDGERRGDGRTSTARPRGRVAAEAGQSGAAVRICTACRLVGHTATVCPSRRSRSAPPSSSRVVAL